MLNSGKRPKNQRRRKNIKGENIKSLKKVVEFSFSIYIIFLDWPKDYFCNELYYTFSPINLKARKKEREKTSQIYQQIIN